MVIKALQRLSMMHLCFRPNNDAAEFDDFSE